MNPVMMQQVLRAESRPRDRELAEIRLINQAFPRSARSDAGPLEALDGSVTRARFTVRRSLARLVGRLSHVVHPAHGRQVSG